MLRVAIRHVRPERVDERRDWLRTVDGPRRNEALATLADETCTVAVDDDTEVELAIGDVAPTDDQEPARS